MSYLYSKLPETGVSPHIGTGGLVSIAEFESSGLLVTFFMAWSPGRRFNAGDSRLITPETTPPSIPTNPATGPPPAINPRNAVANNRSDMIHQEFRL
jgi:hypothetical protein